MLLQAMAKVHQAGGMEDLIAQLPVQSEVPTGVVTQHLHRLSIRHPVLEIEARIEPFENGRGFSLRALPARSPRKKPKG